MAPERTARTYFNCGIVQLLIRKTPGFPFTLEFIVWRLPSHIVSWIVAISFRSRDGFASLNRALLDRGLVVHFKDYYGPFVSTDDIRSSLDEERNIPGLRLNPNVHQAFLAPLDYGDELRTLLNQATAPLRYDYRKGMFGSGDSEILYGLIRHIKPKHLIEVGAGSSTLIAQAAIRRNREEDSTYSCRHTCIEPFENPWLEDLDVEVIRRRVEELPGAFFSVLDRNDILFVDSSHVVKPQGDVLHEVFEIYGSLNVGVYVHVHDIFSPRDYPRAWVLDDRKLWHEQYLLEAFLSFNADFEVVCALNWVWRNHPAWLARACPVLSTSLPNNPGSFWFKRVGKTEALPADKNS